MTVVIAFISLDPCCSFRLQAFVGVGANHRLVETGIVQRVGVIARLLGGVLLTPYTIHSPFLEISTGPPVPRPQPIADSQEWPPGPEIPHGGPGASRSRPQS
jgi:hypothetical protein